MLVGQKLVKVYGSGHATVPAVRGVDLSVRAGEFVAIVGPSGSGKSTLMHLLGLLDTPTSGTLRIAGRNVAGLHDNGRTGLRRELLGFVFQAFNLIQVLTVAENVALPLVIARRRTKESRQRVKALLETVGLIDRADALPAMLSGGEQQRVAVARALVHQPALLLADEPTGSLDQTTGRTLMSLLRSLHLQGQTIVLVTHDPHVASYADRILLMRDGQILDEVAVPEPGDPTFVMPLLVEQEVSLDTSEAEL